MSTGREILTYELFGTAVRELAQQVVDAGYEPDMILAIARGGLGLAMGLGYALDVKNLCAVNVEFYTGVDQRLDVPIMLPPTPAAIDLAGLKVLIADDVADTGKTLEVVRRLRRRPCRRGAHGGDLREAVDGDQARVRLAAHRALDRLPLVGPAAARRPDALAH